MDNCDNILAANAEDSTARIRARLDKLQRDRERLIDAIADADAASGSISSGAGSQSWSQRSVADMRAKLRIVDAEIARLAAALGIAPNPDAIVHIYPNYF